MKKIILTFLFSILFVIPFLSCSGNPNTVIQQKEKSPDLNEQKEIPIQYPPGLIGCWNLDEGSGTTIHDSSGNKATGFLKGNPQWTKGIHGTGLMFDYTDGFDFVEIMSSPLLDTVQEDNYTLSAWFKPLSVPTGSDGSKSPSYGIIMKEGYHIGLLYNINKQFAFYHFLNPGKWAGVITDIAVDPGEFYHIAGVFDYSKGIVRIYINGLCFGEQSFDRNLKVQPLGKNPWRIGIGAPSNPEYPFPAIGIVDEVQIYNRALSEKEINSLVNKIAPADVMITFTKTGDPLIHHAYGIQDSISDNGPDDKYILPLKPHLIRHAKKDMYARAKELNTQFMYMLLIDYLNVYIKWQGHDIGATEDSIFPGDNGKWNKWEEIVAHAVVDAKNKKYDDIIWDIWNEPDGDVFWRRSWDQFLETYKHAVLIIREIDPKALITGPGIGIYNKEKITGFLEFSKKNNVLPDILNWHECGIYEIDTIPSHVYEVKKYMKDNNINIGRIMIPELIGPSYQHSPGYAVGTIAFIHKSQIEACAKTCWFEPAPNNKIHNSEIDSLDGLLDPEHGKPRSVWWAFYEYAQMRGNIISLMVLNKLLFINGIASYDPTGNKAFFLLGRYKRTHENKRDVVLKINNIPESLVVNNLIKITVKKIPNTGVKNLLEPVLIIDSHMEINNNEMEIILPDMGDEDVYSIQISQLH